MVSLTPKLSPVVQAEPAAAPEPAPRLLLPTPLQSAALPEPSRPVAPSSPVQVVLRATQRSWVEIYDGPNNEVFARLMYPGDTFEVPPRSGFTLSTGNAGGIEILVEGRKLPPLGPVGEVRRDVSLDAGALLGSAGPAR